MTREEAIEQLQDAKDGYKEYLSNEALDIAIKALEQKPCNTCKHYENGCHWLPSTTPQKPKTGYWITTRTFMHDGEFYCDKCKCDAPHNKKWDYCPNCGAKMIEPKESEEV